MNALPLPPLVRLIDDDAAFRESHQLLLELEGYEVAVYPGGAEFIAADDLSRPGCILLDIRMPGMSGLEIQQALIDRGSRLPIIILTGHGDVKTAVHTLKAGAFDFIEKSSNPRSFWRPSAAPARSPPSSRSTKRRTRGSSKPTNRSRPASAKCSATPSGACR